MTVMAMEMEPTNLKFTLSARTTRSTSMKYTSIMVTITVHQESDGPHSCRRKREMTGMGPKRTMDLQAIPEPLDIQLAAKRKRRALKKRSLPRGLASSLTREGGNRRGGPQGQQECRKVHTGEAQR